jgi:hypothetical protein
MRERVKVFTYVSGHGTTLVEPPLEEHINQWLAGRAGEVVRVTQSESERSGGGQHVTVCVWYVPAASAPSGAAVPA